MRVGFLRPISSRRRCSAWCPSIRRPRDRPIPPRRLRWPCRPADPCKPAPALWSDRPSRLARRQRGGRVGLRMQQAKGTQAARRGENFASTQALDHLAARSGCAAPFLHGCGRGATRLDDILCQLRTLPSFDHLIGTGEQRSREEFRGTKDYGTSRGHSGFAPENLTTLPHLSISSATSFPKSAGEPGMTVPPSSARRALTAASTKPAFISVLSLSIMWLGVFL